VGQGAAQAPSQGDQAAANAAAAVATGGSDPSQNVAASFNPMAWLAPGGGAAGGDGTTENI